jgi:hypothetical protein
MQPMKKLKYYALMIIDGIYWASGMACVNIAQKIADWEARRMKSR